MPIELCTVGGYNEVGRNCTALKLGNDVILFDLGIHVEHYIQFTEDEDLINLDPKALTLAGAIPDLKYIQDWKTNVKAIIPSHAHLDHIGAIPFIAKTFSAPVIGSPYTTSVISTILKNEKIKLPNPLQTLKAGGRMRITPQLEVEFVHTTHSTPDTVMVALHTPEGVVLYANDFKFDLYPVLGRTPDFKRLQELGKKGVLALIVDSTYANYPIKMPSETVARDMMKDVLLGTDARGKAIIVTTFSSHIARLKSIIDIGKKLNRKIVFLGRSLAKYVGAAEDIKIVQFSKDVEIVKYASKIKRKLRNIMKEGKHKYLIVVTGHQGEPKATLSKMAARVTDFRFDPGDHVVFSCKIIPTPTNELNRKNIERRLRDFNVRIFRDIHVSGHAGRQDVRDLITLLKPKHIIPSHGTPAMRGALAELAYEMGYKKEHIHLLSDGQRINLPSS